MKSKEFEMPAFGVGPIYVLTCLLLTIGGLYLHFKGFLSLSQCKQGQFIFKITGFALIMAGLYLWIQAVIVEKINRKTHEGQLITTGVYSLVRNPVYTAFIFVFTGILLLTGNIILLGLPVFFWAFLTILMKKTEEKWLKNKFGQEYQIYSSRVNRVIPWFKRK